MIALRICPYMAMSSKTPPIPPLFKLAGQVFEVRWGPQGVEGRIVEGRGRRAK